MIAPDEMRRTALGRYNTSLAMRRYHCVVALFLASLFGAQNTFAAQAAESPGALSHFAPHVQALFARLKTLADSGDLFDPASVAERLDMKFQAETKEQQIPPAAACRSNGTGLRFLQRTTLTPVGDIWYRPMPGGVPDMPIPAFLVNPASSAGQASVTYTINRSAGCSDPPNARGGTVASLSLKGLPSFACVSALDVEALLPGAQWIMATDGVSYVFYQGRLDDDAGVRVEVFFRAGAQCAIGAMVTQSQRDGLRYKRAEAKQRNCGVQVTRSFCATRKPFGWSDVAAQNELHDAILATCGTVGQLMESDTERGTPPAPWPKWKRGAAPCNVYDE